MSAAMEDWLLYSLRSAGVLAVFYLFYKVLLSRETFHRFNRAVLLLSVVLAAVLPLCQITCYREVAMVMPDVTDTPLLLPVVAVQDGASDTGSWIGTVGMIYLCGVAVCLLYGLVSAGAIVRLLREGRSYRFGRHGVRLVLHGRKEAPFSWIRWIVLSEHDFRTAARPIVTHESAHLRSGHSWDLLTIDLLGAVQWFNPAMWLVRAELRAIHEYEADAAVLRSGADAREYQLLLIKKAVGARWCSVANSFNHSKLKNRITMMLREKSSARTALRALYLVPLTGFALGAFARTVILPVYPADKVSETSAFVQASEAEKTAVVQEPCVGTDPATSANGAVASAVTVPTEKKTLKRVSGTVRADGTPLVGALVRVSGQKRGAVTDAEGRFSMAVAPGEVLEVSYVGRKKELVKVDDPDRSVYVDLAAADSRTAVADTVTSVRAGDSKSVVYIVDGKEVDMVDGLDPDRIKSISILKNPEAIAKYGERARDGVIVITTKSSQTADPVMPNIDSMTVGRVKSVRAGDFKSALYVLDGRVVDRTEALDLKRAESFSISVLKNSEAVAKYGERARDGVIVVTTESSKIAAPAVPNIDLNTVSRVKSVRVGGSKSVVYIVDGKEVDTVEGLDPNQIKSISILKNPEAIAEYGERARSGVMVVTTKSSKTADPAVPNIDLKTVGRVKSVRVGGSKSVVYIVDGKEVDTVEDLDPDRIKSISILKNPEAIAKYGERARGGVIVVTTKSSGADGGTGVVISRSSKSK